MSLSLSLCLVSLSLSVRLFRRSNHNLERDNSHAPLIGIFFISFSSNFFGSPTNSGFFMMSMERTPSFIEQSILSASAASGSAKMRSTLPEDLSIACHFTEPSDDCSSSSCLIDFIALMCKLFSLSTFTSTLATLHPGSSPDK